MDGWRDLVRRLMPVRLFNWFRRKRLGLLESAPGATSVTPYVLKRAVANKTYPLTSRARSTAVRVLPDPVVNVYRRRRATKRYLRALSYEILEKETRLDYLEGRVAARRDGFYHRIVSDVLERTEIILQELDRRIEGVSARTGQELAAMEQQLLELKQEIVRLRELQEAAADNGDVPAKRTATARGTRTAARPGSRKKPPAAVAE